MEGRTATSTHGSLHSDNGNDYRVHPHWLIVQAFTGGCDTVGELLIVSNRLPSRVEMRDGELRFKDSVGGLATGLSSFHESNQTLWVGWPGIASERIQEMRDDIKKELASRNCYPVFLSQRQVQQHYHGFCNRTIWPLFHYFPESAAFESTLWSKYREVSEEFCDVLAEIARPGDSIWIHDYHLLLLPKIVRERIPDVKIGFFLHIPFPSSEVFRLLPWRKQILEGLLGADLVGFHTHDYAMHFLQSVHRLLGHEHTLGRITLKNREVRVDAFPMGIDCERFAESAQSAEVEKEIEKIHRKVGDRRILLSIDRLDYSKGIPQRLRAFDLFLGKNKEYRENVTLILVAVPSRTRVERYRLLKKQTDELVGRVNGKYGTVGWTPVWYLYRSVPFHNLVALYAAADVAVVTPIRDGMNLIAKEYVMSRTDKNGVLVLSEMAGASSELGEAIIVNPNSIEEMAAAMKLALIMEEDERATRMAAMQERLRLHDVDRWVNDFVHALETGAGIRRESASKEITADVTDELLSDYRKSERRLLLLDYDGTLVPFTDEPEAAVPDDDLLGILEDLSRDERNEIVIVSGRERKALEKWLGDLNAGLVAEHGAWLREQGKDWRTIKSLESRWKKAIKPVMELHADRTPGSFLEEKDFSLAWHYRNADPEQGIFRARELADTLLNLTSHLNLNILESNKVVEVRSSEINKGRAFLSWMSRGKWDFVLAAGDDETDEDVFAVLPESAYSIKIGPGASRANFLLRSPEDARSLLMKMSGISSVRSEKELSKESTEAASSRAGKRSRNRSRTTGDNI
ncbi:MAG: bifunctional alpha,alpha-trehalose-phosphate synthase (UDP-forming)/trehalose-phosphatase [Thermoplasmata archaeon]